MLRLRFPGLLILALALLVADSASAQSIWLRPQPLRGMPRRPPVRQTQPPPTIDEVPRHVVSTGPTALLFRLPNLEYEVRTSRYLTVGVSGSRTHWTLGHVSTNGEVFARLFPEGIAFHGFSVGMRTGYTHISDAGRFRSVALEGGYTVTSKKRAYMSMTMGARHILGGPDSIFGPNHPIFRMNVGVGF